MDKVKIEEKRGLYDEYSQTDDDGIEFWYARDLMEPMGYSRWENFSGAIQRAALSCENAKMPVDAHFREVTKMVESGVAPVPRQDFMLTRYACYLVHLSSLSKVFLKKNYEANWSGHYKG